MKAVFMGSFQPVTNGHVDIITRASRLCDEVFAVVGYNPEKPLLVPVSARERWLKQAVSHLNNVRVESFAGALADFCVQVGADCIIKSVRNASDFCVEADMAYFNKRLCGIETLLLPADEKYIHLSSTFVRELIKCKKDVSLYVPQGLAKEISEAFK